MEKAEAISENHGWSNTKSNWSWGSQPQMVYLLHISNNLGLGDIKEEGEKG